MTLDQFIATKTFLPFYVIEGFNGPHPSFVYYGGLNIQLIPDMAGESLCLTIGNQQHVSNNLSALEGVLYAYALSDGAF